MDKVRWGIIGCGNVCEEKSGPGFYKANHSELVAVMRRDENLVVDFARRHGVPKYYSDVDQLINDPEVDIVYIATPPSTHKEYAIKTLMAGKPVYVEKPMALDYAECHDMIRAAEQTNQKLFVAYYRRALPYFLKIKELLDNESIGRILAVDVKLLRPQSRQLDNDKYVWRLDASVGGEGYFYDLAPHTLDILDFLLGQIDEVKGFTSNRGGLYAVADTVSAAWKFQTGVLGSGLWTFVASEDASEDSITILGEKGSIRFSTFDFKPIELKTKGGVQLFEIDKPQHIQQPLIQTIVDELRGLGKCPSDAYSAARTSHIIDQIFGKI